MKSPRIVQLATCAMVVFGSLGTAFADDIEYSFTTIDVPGATRTSAYGINDSGQIVGGYVDTSGDHGFLYSGGSFTTIDVPGATVTSPNGINDSGQIVGTYTDSSGFHGFLYSGGNFTTIDVPGDYSPPGPGTRARGINDAGQVVGWFNPSTGPTTGFLYSGGSFTQIYAPGSPSPDVALSDINNTGQIVGQLAPGGSFIYIGGTFTKIDLPGATLTIAEGINDAGQIAGFYIVYANSSFSDHGFLYSGGSFTTIDVPGGQDTYASGINDIGQIVGGYGSSPSATTHGFLATPTVVPEPCTLPVLAGGLLSMCAMARRRKHA